MLRLRRPRLGVSIAPFVPFIAPAPVLLGAEGDRPPLDVDLTLLLPNGKPTEEMLPLKN